MDKKQILKEAKDTIDNIKEVQTSLDSYLRRLENIVEKIEFESFKKENLTSTDVAKIQEKLKASEEEMTKNQVDLEKEVDQALDNVKDVGTKAVIVKDEKKVKSKQKKVKRSKKQKASGFLVNFLIIIGILSLVLTLFLNVKKVKPDINIFDHYIYSYQDSNMEPEVEYNSLVIINKLKKQPVLVNDNLSYKINDDSVKIVNVNELVDNRQDTFKVKSISHQFEDEEVLTRQETLGRIVYILPVIGGIFTTLINNLWLMYLISGLFLIIAYLLNIKTID